MSNQSLNKVCWDAVQIRILLYKGVDRVKPVNKPFYNLNDEDGRQNSASLSTDLPVGF
jgi:hypothetical protein